MCTIVDVSRAGAARCLVSVLFVMTLSGTVSAEEAAPLPVAALPDARLSLVPPALPSPIGLRERGRRRQKRAGLGLMIAGAASLLVVPLLWAVAIPVDQAATRANPDSDTGFVMGGMAGYGSVAFGMVGGQLLTVGAILYKDARDDERRVVAGPTGISLRF